MAILYPGYRLAYRLDYIYTPGVRYGLGQFNPTDHRDILWSCGV